MSKYKVGDKVRIVSAWSEGSIHNNRGAMDHWLGKVMTIRIAGSGYYWMQEDIMENSSCGWAWNDAMIAGLVESESSTESKSATDPADRNFDDWVVVDREPRIGDYVRLIGREWSFSTVGDVLRITEKRKDGPYLIAIKDHIQVAKKMSHSYEPDYIWCYSRRNLAVIEPRKSYTYKPCYILYKCVDVSFEESGKIGYLSQDQLASKHFYTNYRKVIE